MYTTVETRSTTPPTLSASGNTTTSTISSSNANASARNAPTVSSTDAAEVRNDSTESTIANDSDNNGDGTVSIQLQQKAADNAMIDYSNSKTHNDKLEQIGKQIAKGNDDKLEQIMDSIRDATADAFHHGYQAGMNARGVEHAVTTHRNNDQSYDDFASLVESVIRTGLTAVSAYTGGSASQQPPPTIHVYQGGTVYHGDQNIQNNNYYGGNGVGGSTGAANNGSAGTVRLHPDDVAEMTGIARGMEERLMTQMRQMETQMRQMEERITGHINQVREEIEKEPRASPDLSRV